MYSKRASQPRSFSRAAAAENVAAAEAADVDDVVVVALISVLAQRKLLLELPTDLAVHGNQLLARTDERLARSESC